MAGKSDVRGLETVINNMNSLAPAVLSHLEMAVQEAGKELYATVNEHISLTCHTLADLASENHPYSVVYGEDSFDTPDDFVHIQSGKLFASVELIAEIDKDSAVIAVGVSEAKVPYIGYLIDGTSKMRPRDFLGNAMKERRDDLLAIIKYGIVNGLGSRGGTR